MARKLTDTQVRQIRYEYKKGVQVDVLAHCYDMSVLAINDVVNGVSHQNVSDASVLTRKPNEHVHKIRYEVPLAELFEKLGIDAIPSGPSTSDIKIDFYSSAYDWQKRSLNIIVWSKNPPGHNEPHPESAQLRNNPEEWGTGH